MKIYNDITLENSFLIEEAEQLRTGGFITPVQLTDIKGTLESLKKQDSILIRIGLFLLGTILYMSFCGVCSLMLLNNSSEGFYKFIVFLFAIIGFAGAEIIITQKKYYRYGLEEAFIIGGQVAFVSFVALEMHNHPLYIPLAITVIASLSALRYLHFLSVVFAFIGVVYTLCELTTEVIHANHLFLPFILMAFAVLVYFLSNRSYNRMNPSYYAQGVHLIRSLSLIIFYLSCNYGISQYYLPFYFFPLNAGTPFSVFFWFLTFIVPMCYIFFSLRQKDRVMFWVGCLSMALSFYTYRMYYQLLPLELALTFGGILLFSIAYYSIWKLRNKEVGLTFKPNRFNDKNALLNAEALMVTSQLGMKPLGNQAEAKPFSGGEGFDGGGAGGSF